MINIVEKLDQETAKNIRQSVRHSNRASELGWWEDCPNYLVLVRTQPEKLPLHGIGLQRIFDEGKKQEKLIRMELEEAGFEVYDIQRDERWKDLKITGHIDGRIVLNGTAPLLEIKSCSPNVFRAISSITEAADLRDSRYFWIKHYFAQMQGYHLLFNEEAGVILFKDKSTGQKHQINSTLDYDYCERMIRVIEEVNDRVERNDPWPVKMVEACKRCGFAKTVCFPGQDYGPGIELLDDGELELKLIRRHELKPLAKEYGDIDKELKEIFKGRNAVVGDFIIESREYERTNYAIPKEIKEQYAEKSSYFRTSIEKLGNDSSI